MPPTPKPGSIKGLFKIAAAAVAKSVKAKAAATANKKVVPTADSTKHYASENKFYRNQSITDAEFGYRQSANDNAAKAAKANKDLLRQAFKGLPGYDKNGYPIKKSKVGGIVKSKIKSKKK